MPHGVKNSLRLLVVRLHLVQTSITMIVKLNFNVSLYKKQRTPEKPKSRREVTPEVIVAYLQEVFLSHLFRLKHPLVITFVALAIKSSSCSMLKMSASVSGLDHLTWSVSYLKDC